MKSKTLSLTLCTLLSVTGSAYASSGDFSIYGPKEEIKFEGNVEAQCGLRIKEDKGALAYGDYYFEDAAEIQVVDNRQDGQVLIKLSELEYEEEDFPEEIDFTYFHFKLTGASEQVGNANEWFDGKTFTRSDLGDDRTLQIRARVSLTEEEAVARDNVTIETEWITFCS